MNLQYRIDLFLIIAFFSAASSTSEITIGTQHILKSQLLSEQRAVQVYLPESYHNTKKSYPVLFVMDSQRYFLHAIAHQQTLRFQDKTPEMIVVGVKTDNRKRRPWLNRNKQPFMKFLAFELMPWVENHYRISDERLYFGWEMAAGLVPDLIAEYPSLFSAFFMASPTHINQQRIETIKAYLRKPVREHFIYATLADVETWSKGSMLALEQAITSASENAIKWEYDLMPNHDHYTTPLVTIHNGLLKHFENYAPIRFYSLKEFEVFGGLNALEQYYENRAKRFDVPHEVHDDTIHYLLNQSVKEQNFPMFASIAEHFQGFIPRFYTRDFWFERFANAYQELEQYQSSLEVLNAGIKKLPSSPKLYAALGNLYQRQDQLELAKGAFEKALTLSQPGTELHSQVLSKINDLKM